MAAAMILNSFAVLAALLVFAWLGSFSRYQADDFCDTMLVRKAPGLGAVIDRYVAGQWRAADRYSNLLLVSVSESLGQHNMQFIMVAMIVIWVVGLIWTTHGLRRLASLDWPLWLDYFLPATLAFLAILQAPNRFQTLYWRSGMVTHFAPLVFLFLLVGFVLQRIRRSGDRLPSFWTGLFIFLAAFLVGGFSEPPVTFVIVAVSLALPVILHFAREGTRKRYALVLLAWLLSGATMAFLVLFFSPAHLTVGAPARSLPVLAADTLRFTFEFMADSLKVLPVPTAVSILVPGLLFLSLYLGPDRQSLPRVHSRTIWLLVVALPLVVYILIAASFAPSAYGQSYPVERARFLGRILMTAGLMLEGILLGILAGTQTVWRVPRLPVFALAAVVFLLLGLYPIRSAWFTLSADLPQYRQLAAEWDARDARIRAFRADGITDIIVSTLPDPYGVRELRDDPKHWINRCAADFYGVHSLSARR